MQQLTIADAIGRLEQLYKSLVSAYWDSTQIQHKDTVFDIISVITGELSELNKLSIEDHHMAYEAVSSEFRLCGPKLSQLHARIDEWFPRTQTANSLTDTLNSARPLLPR